MDVETELHGQLIYVYGKSITAERLVVETVPGTINKSKHMF